jgi:hypothetical protein
MRLPKDPTELLRLLIDVGILDEKLELSGEYFRRWYRLTTAIIKNPMAKDKAIREGIDLGGASHVSAIVSFFADGIHKDDVQIIYNHIHEQLDKIPAIPYKA